MLLVHAPNQHVGGDGSIYSFGTNAFEVTANSEDVIGFVQASVEMHRTGPLGLANLSSEVPLGF